MRKNMLSSLAWPSCKQQPRTSSFREISNAAYYSTTDSFFTVSSSENSETVSNSTDDVVDSESLIRGLAGSARLFVEPGGDTSSILGRKTVPFEESVAMAMESEDPYLDFKKSMEEMVAAHRIREWDRLEEMLVWYLKVNGKKTHGYIVGAFVDLLVGISTNDHEHDSSSSSSSSSSSCYGSSMSVSSASRNCCEIEEAEEEGSSISL